MRTSIFHTAVALSDADLLARTRGFAQSEREATAELVAHLAALEMRPSAYAALGHGSLFGYCTEVLRLSEDAACTRIAVARLCRQFPLIADLMASGSLSLTTVRLVGPHLTPANHDEVLRRASNKHRTEIQGLVAELAPQPDLPASVRKLPCPQVASGMSATEAETSTLWTEAGAGVPLPPVDRMGTGMDTQCRRIPEAGAATPTDDTERTAFVPAAAPVATARAPRPVVQASAPDRYRVQFTIGRQAHDELRRVQALLRREVPDGDPGAIFERALHLLVEQVEKAKLGTGRARRVIRPETDKPAEAPVAAPHPFPTAPRRSRHVPKAVRQAVWKRDGARCAFVGPSRNRCTERSYLEFHHVQPFAREGPATLANIALRCRRHNQYEGELVFGTRVEGKGTEGTAP
jgi:HNH endonuclease